MGEQFSGLGVGLGNLSRLSQARTRSICPRTSPGEKGKGGMATEGTGAGCARDLGQGWKVSPSIEIAAGREPSAGRHRRPRRDPADLDDRRQGALARSASCASTGTTRSTRRSSARSATSSPAAGASTRRSPRWRSASTPAARSTATGRCRSASAPHHAGEPRAGADDPLLPDQLHAHRRARGRGLLPRPVPPHQPAALQGGSTPSSTASQGQGHYVGTYMAWGVNNNGWWGEGEIKFFMDGDERVPDHLRHRHRRLLLRLLQLRRRHHGPDSERLPRVHHALRRPAPGASGPTASTQSSSASACTAGTSPTRSGSSRTCGSPSRRWAGDRAAAATCRCRTTSPRSPTGTRRCRRRRSPNCPTATTSRSSEADAPPPLHRRAACGLCAGRSCSPSPSCSLCRALAQPIRWRPCWPRWRRKAPIWTPRRSTCCASRWPIHSGLSGSLLEQYWAFINASSSPRISVHRSRCTRPR